MCSKRCKVFRLNLAFSLKRLLLEFEGAGADDSDTVAVEAGNGGGGARREQTAIKNGGQREVVGCAGGAAGFGFMKLSIGQGIGKSMLDGGGGETSRLAAAIGAGGGEGDVGGLG